MSSVTDVLQLRDLRVQRRGSQHGLIISRRVCIHDMQLSYSSRESDELPERPLYLHRSVLKR